MALLEVKGLTKTFKKKRMSIPALDNVSFTIEAGECLGLVGESGSGKSTAAGIIARLLSEDAGSIEFDGKVINDSRYLAPVGRNLQMVFQNPQDSFDPRDTVLEGIMQGAMSYGIWDKQTLREKALEIFDFVGLKQSYMNMKTSELSGGECQRAAIARAIICEPKLVICDEATSALDVLVQAQVINLLKRLKAEKHMSLLFITHDLPLAASLCDRIAVMHQGKIVEIGDTWSILHEPCSEYTRALIESILPVPSKPLMGKGDIS